jgi:hypothetical protein
MQQPEHARVVDAYEEATTLLVDLSTNLDNLQQQP